MSRLSKLVGKPTEVNIGGETLLIKPLTVKDMPFLMSMNDKNPDKQAEAIAYVITTTLRNSVPDASDEEINSVAVSYIQELTEAILKVNGLDKHVVKKQGAEPSVKQS